MEIKMGMTMANISKYFDNSKEQLIDTNESEVLAFIEKRDEYKIVYDIVNSQPIECGTMKVNLKDGEIVIVSKKDNKLIAKTHSIKKRVDLHTVIKNEIGSEIKMIYGVETNSNNSIVITVNTDNIVHIKNRLISAI
jgi:predicted DNA-binding antitoxin AbrB/MazE fold protein